ncbi:hypothetical protein [Agaribacterium haliotis]|uniref:hypothetical protein n=1 Tax=Agaribacterium haliotis TaxID=2013869 RepID=UPI0011782924|nr:hypothetical protein [Agaribacterium haliotis]
MFKKVKILVLFLFVVASSVSHSEGSGQTVEQIFYCGDDFAMRMSGGDWYLVQKSKVGEKKLDHFLSLAMFMMASGKKTANVFPGDKIDQWCGTSNLRPIHILSVKN